MTENISGHIRSMVDNSINLVERLDENENFMQNYLGSAAPRSKAAGVYHRAEKKMNAIACRLYNWSIAASALERCNIGVEERSSLTLYVQELNRIHADNHFLMNEMASNCPKRVRDNYPKITRHIQEIRVNLQGIGRALRNENPLIDIGGGDGIEG